MLVRLRAVESVSSRREERAGSLRGTWFRVWFRRDRVMRGAPRVIYLSNGAGHRNDR